jgi:L-fucose mutarotase
MLRYRLQHPGILAALAKAGHGSRVLIADGNYAFATNSCATADHVYLNLAPGVVNATEVLAALLTAIAVERAAVMAPDDGPEPTIFAEYRQLLGPTPSLDRFNRQEFYQAALGHQVALVIATAEQRLYANILLTIGVVSQ